MDLATSFLTKVEAKVQGLYLPPEPQNLYAPLSYFLTMKSERIRPVLTLFSAALFENQVQEIEDVALGIELLHTFVLLHDDFIYDIPKRGNLETVPKKWNTETAILSGDTLFIKAMESIWKGKSNTLNNLFLKTTKEICEGQQLEMDLKNKPANTSNDYNTMLRLKVGALFGCAMQAGAILSGADENNQTQAYQVGIHLGLGYQMQEDFFTKYKTTRQARLADKGDVLQTKILNNTFLTPAFFQEQIAFHFQESKKYLTQITLPKERKQALNEFINVLQNRNHKY